MIHLNNFISSKIPYKTVQNRFKNVTINKAHPYLGCQSRGNFYKGQIGNNNTGIGGRNEMFQCFCPLFLMIQFNQGAGIKKISPDQTLSSRSLIISALKSPGIEANSFLALRKELGALKAFVSSGNSILTLIV